jgi:hypothetical protein
MDPFIDLYVGFTQYSTVREVILLGDSNYCTRSIQIPLHDRLKDMFYMQEIDPTSPNVRLYILCSSLQSLVV